MSTEYRNPWDMSWQEFDLVLGQTPLVQALNLQVHSRERATELLRHAGMDLSDAHQRQSSERLLGEGMHFLRHSLMTDEEREVLPVPIHLQESDDIRDYLLTASDLHPRRQYDRLWCCALLKVIHAIANLEFSGKLESLSQARSQIFQRVRRHICEESQSLYFLHPRGEKILLTTVDWKEEKTRKSLIMKLIHKQENLVDDVHDYMGVRFVVQEMQSIALLLDALILTDIVIPHQVIAPRSRNTLCDFSRGRDLLRLVKDLSNYGKLSVQESQQVRDRVNWSYRNSSPLDGRNNRFSAQQFRSIQLTVRHLVKLENPAHAALMALSNQLENYQNVQRRDHWLEKVVPQHNIRYFPLELQIFDQESYAESRFGSASHQNYKASQLKAARKRILGPLLKYRSQFPS